MEPRELPRAPRISGINVIGETVDIDYLANLMNVVVFFEPVTKNSIDTVGLIRLFAERYQKLSVGFWYVMEPRLSCMYHGSIAQVTLERLGLFQPRGSAQSASASRGGEPSAQTSTIFDANNMILLRSGIRVVPAVLAVDSNSFIRSQYEGEVSFRELERTIQARLASSGYRDDLPTIGEMDYDFLHSCGGSVMRQLGYAMGDYVFSSEAVPEMDQQFSLPGFCLPNTIYPVGAWFVGRDYIEGKSGSTVYISCSRDESVHVFAGSEEGTVVRVHTSIESAEHLVLGKDVKKNAGGLETVMDEFRSYEMLAVSGDTDVLISLQVATGSMKLYCVEYCQSPQSRDPLDRVQLSTVNP